MRWYVERYNLTRHFLAVKSPDENPDESGARAVGDAETGEQSTAPSGGDRTVLFAGGAANQ